MFKILFIYRQFVCYCFCQTSIEFQMPLPLRIIHEDVLSPNNPSDADGNREQMQKNAELLKFQNSMLILVRQICTLARNSESILIDIFDDSCKVNQRWRKLNNRLTKIREKIDLLVKCDLQKLGNIINRAI